MVRWALAALLLAHAAAAFAQTAPVISPAPDKVAVTIYRNPDRAIATKMELDDLGSFALIAETRTVDLPPGVVTIRFEGVASGIVPHSAILFGGDIREKNRDAALLSQKGLLDGFTGQRVTLQRTDPATGRTVEEPATIRSRAEGLVVTTPRGVEAVYCSGLNQTILFPGVPRTLSPKPVLTMTTHDQPGGRRTITLAYLSQKFDWDATYLGTLSPDGRDLALFAWLTMASGDDTSFVDATTAAVAGRVGRDQDTRDDTGERVREEAERFTPRWSCWAQGTTTSGLSPPPPPPPPPPPMVMSAPVSADIVVTGQRVEARSASAPIAVMAQGESLGDLKLYRIPVPVTVAARSQKQVAFLVKDRIRGRIVYRYRAGRGGDVEMLYRFRNDRKSGAGDPLPAGRVALFQQGPYGRMLVGETETADKTVDEDVDLLFGEATNVTAEDEDQASGDGWEDQVLTVRNANPHPIAFEAEFDGAGYRLDRLSARVIQRRGKRIWSVSVPANGTSVLRYRRHEVD